MLLELLSLPAMALSGLRRKGIKNLADLTALSEEEFANINGSGRQSLTIVHAEMKRQEISFRPHEQSQTKRAVKIIYDQVFA
jgi:DNA-directed RNA polymerase alpha subunit